FGRWRRASWSCRGRSRRQAFARAAPATGPARKSAEAPWRLLDGLVGRVDPFPDPAKEHELSDENGGAGVIRGLDDRLAEGFLERPALPGKLVGQHIERRRILAGGGRFEALARLELLHEELRRHLRIGLESDVHAVKLEQVLRTLHGILERPIGLVQT